MKKKTNKIKKFKKMQLINLALLLLSSAFICESRGPVVINPKNPNDPPTLPPNVTKNVLIVGGGLAGMRLI